MPDKTETQEALEALTKAAISTCYNGREVDLNEVEHFIQLEETIRAALQDRGDVEKVLMCKSCASEKRIQELQETGHISCCPERKMEYVPVKQQPEKDRVMELMADALQQEVKSALATADQQDRRDNPTYILSGDEQTIMNDALLSSVKVVDDEKDSIKTIRDALATAGQQDRGDELLEWRKGEPPHPNNQEWFIAKTKRRDKVVLRALPDENSYDYTTADETYIKADQIEAWMQFPNSHYCEPEYESRALKEKIANYHEKDRVMELMADALESCNRPAIFVHDYDEDKVKHALSEYAKVKGE